MNKNQLLDSIRSKYPDIPILKRQLAKYRLKRTKRLYLSENQISDAEGDLTKKRILTDTCKKKWTKYYAQTEKKISEILKKAPEYQNRTDLNDIKTDMLFCRFAYGFQPDEYLCFELENKSMKERRTYVSDLDRYCYVYQLNDLSDIQIFNNKGKTYNRFGQYYKREALYIVGKNDFDKFQTFVKRHPIFVKKAVFEGMGRSVELVEMSKSKKSEERIFLDMITQGPHIIEELVVQNKALAQLNTSSVNTIRCITFNTKNGVVIPYCFMKVGRKGSFVDNGGAGGILIGIDEKKGILNTHGYDEYNREFEIHPDSGVRFMGYQLPEWKQMIEICKRMSSMVPKVNYIGWDMTYTDKGWIVIEGNGMSQLIGPQIVYKRGIKPEIINIVEKINLNI